MRTTIIILVFLFLSINIFSQNIGINDDGSTPDNSAILDVKSNAHDKGMLLPRMSEAQKNAISSPATGLVVFQTDGSSGFYYYNGSSWTKLSNDKVTYATVIAAEAASGTNNNLCYVVETETYYRYIASGSGFTDDNKYVLSTGDGGNTRWIGIAGQYNLGDISLSKINHLDATSGSATITELNKIYYIQAASSTTTITIPDADAENEGWFLRLYKESGNGIINIVTSGGQNIDGSNPAKIYKIGKGFYIKSNNSTNWLKIQDSRSKIPVVINITADYTATDDWMFDYMLANTNSGNLTITLPSDISGFLEGDLRMFFNTGSNIVYGDPNGNVIDGTSEIRAIAPNGYIELQKLNGVIKIVREKNVTIRKNVDDISNLVCWLDASVLSGTDGSDVTTWTDLKNSYNFVGTGTAKPTLQVNEQNGKNVVRFDGTNDVLSAGDIEVHDNSRGLSIIAVVRPNVHKRMTIVGKYNTSGDNRQYAFGDDVNYLFETGAWSSATNAHATMTQNKFQIYEMIWEPGSPMQLYINGVLQDAGSSNVNDIYDGTSNLKIGCADYTYAGYWDGDMAEIIIYSDAISSTERKLLRDNLSLKWNIDEILIANGGTKYWKRDDDINTISPDVDNDNLDIGTGTYTGQTAVVDTMTVNNLINAPTSATAPASPQVGSIYYNTTDNKLKVYTGSAWADLN